MEKAKYIFVSHLNIICKVLRQITDNQGIYFETKQGNFDTCDCLWLYTKEEVKRCKEQLNAEIKF